MDRVQSPLIPLVGKLIQNNPGTISLGQGVVNYPPPEQAIASLQSFLAESNNHLYQGVTGIEPLKAVIQAKLATDNQIEINHQNSIVVTAGSNMAFMNAMLAITKAGDEIILNTPYYFNHEMAIAIANCYPVLVSTTKDYQLDIKALSQAITPKTKAIVTISPNNPTGAVYSADSLQGVNDLCRDRGIYHISDEAYEYFTYDGAKHYSPGSFPHSEAHTISLFSLSKAYGFASWRIGYMVIPQHLLMPIEKVQDTNLICPPVVSQYAAMGALKTGIVYCQQHLPQITRVREIVGNQLRSIPHLCQVSSASGAFYFFLKINTKLDDLKLVKQLVKQYRVAVIPGSTFGIENGCYLRVAYGSLQPSTAKLGIERLVIGLQDICS
ncbi:pyridoxal phosphate-dependent aminotransferase [Waterburya agarophytonicola K14]|uniref:Pyridoxal phosphate-dependent aminotransferase n=2 Tax=Waterburya TaxID=2886915 RepID=A0A964BTX7_9CYAN|nr:pyridoxal phosphate-dependent aminotransferase [Waterburya agarophytonicola KI4]